MVSESQTLSLAADMKPQCSLALHRRRLTESIVGRPIELGAIEQSLTAARAGLGALTVEGEPGLGKTRLLLAAADLAAVQGFTTIAVTTDEEIRGPFLLARSIFASQEAQDAAEGTSAKTTLRHVVDAIAGKDDPGLEGLAPDQKLLRAFDLGSIALRSLASQAPLAILIDDLQWADEDSLRLLRYVVRTDATSPIFLMFTIRPDELAFVNEAVTLLADMERVGLVRRLKLERFTPVETGDFLKQVLGGQINHTSAAAMHAQAEGVPFIVEELAHAYRDTGMIQQIDGVWTLARNAEKLVPSAVRTLIQRRAARLPDDTKASLGEAAVLGRTFSLRDLLAVKLHLGDECGETQSLAEALEPAVTAGLLLQHPETSAADYSFTHEQVREFAATAVPSTRRRKIHKAIVELLTSNGPPRDVSLPLIAHHALAAGDSARSAFFSVAAARVAIGSHAPEEALRLVELALPVSSAPQDRVDLLCARDDALAILRRPADRLEGLSELAALVEAMSEPRLELDVTLRRAASLRLSEEEDRAAELARSVATKAKELGDKKAELAALLELGQAVLKSPLGEGYAATPHEVDLDAAQEAYARAAALAEELSDEVKIADVSRELGTILVARVRAWFVERVQAGEHIEIMQRVLAGEKVEDMLPELPIAPMANEAVVHFQRALEIYERIGDRRGAMATIIAMAYLSWGPDIHMPGSAKRIEEIRRLSTQFSSFTSESQRELADAQMLYGVHVYARAKIFPDLAISRGEEAYQAARRLGDRGLEFASAGGVALTHLDLGEPELAGRWLDKAAAVAQAAPTPLRARQLELWRGRTCEVAGDAAHMREHLERAVRLASDQGRPAARCEALAELATSAATLGAGRMDEDLLSVAESAAYDAKAIASVLPGRAMWSAQADAALARVALAHGDVAAAAENGRRALAAFQEALREDAHLEIVLPAGAAVLAGGGEVEKETVRAQLSLQLAMIAHHILDEDVRVRWFRSPLGQELASLAGPFETPSHPDADAADGRPSVDAEEERLLKLLVEGRTNSEIGRELGMTEGAISMRLTELFARIGASSRAEATAFALMGKLI